MIRHRVQRKAFFGDSPKVFLQIIRDALEESESENYNLSVFDGLVAYAIHIRLNIILSKLKRSHAEVFLYILAEK